MARIGPILRAALLLSVPLLAAAPARAQTVDDLRTQIEQARNSILEAARVLTPESSAAASAALAQASAGLTAAQTLLDDAAIAAALGDAATKVGRALDGTVKKVGAAQVVVENDRAKFKQKLSKLKAASKSAFLAGIKVAKPVVGEINAKTAGFHKPGEVVRFRIYAADGTPCGEPPVVTVENGSSLAEAIDLDSVAVDETTGEITITMGSQQGGGRISVTACGRTSTVLVYNYGPPAVPGLPAGFPSGLPKGNYLLSYSASGEVTIPSTPLGTFPLVNVKDFAKALVSAFQSAVAATNPGGNCTQGVGYSAWNGSSFSVTYTVTCTDGEVSATQTTTFTLTKL